MSGPRKLTPEQAREIRKAHGLKLALVDALQALFDKPALARQYGVAPNTIDRIIRNESYREVQHGG